MTKAVLTSISQLALKALLYEVSLSPKPGLVDRFDNGAHDDMSFMTFIDSMIALSPFFRLISKQVLLMQKKSHFFCLTVLGN